MRVKTSGLLGGAGSAVLDSRAAAGGCACGVGTESAAAIMLVDWLLGDELASGRGLGEAACIWP